MSLILSITKCSKGSFIKSEMSSDYKITNNAETINNSDAIILVGIGSYSHAMMKIRKFNSDGLERWRSFYRDL